MATLTFADEPESLDAGWAAVEGFRKRLDAAGIAQPLIVPENGEKNGRLHFHAAMPEFVPKEVLAALWGHGFVDVRKLRPRRSSSGVGAAGGREMARAVAGYVAAYISKGDKTAGAGDRQLVADAGPAVSASGVNRRRYSVPKHSHPEPVRFMCWSVFDAWCEIEAQCGHQVREVWHSPSDDDEWRGPPTLLLMG